jgi:hypothetical protein
MDVSSEDNHTIATAIQYLDDYPQSGQNYHHFTASDKHLNPKILLKAALDHAPSFAGRVNVAKFIVNADEDTWRKPRNTRLEELASHVYTNLLVPCTHNLLSSLTAVQAKGGSTRQVSEKSTPPSGYELNSDGLRMVNRRTSRRKQVLSLWATLIPGLSAMQLHLPNDKYQG